MAKFNLDIVSTNGRIDVKNKQAIVEFGIKLESKSELESLITKLKQDSKIIDVYRTAN